MRLRRHEDTKPRKHEITKTRNHESTKHETTSEQQVLLRAFEPSWLRLLVVGGAVCVAVVFLFSRTFTYPFLNWDDQEVFVRNTALHAPGLLRWAFTTTYIEHYQPLAWLTWGALNRVQPLTPAAAHALNVGLHAACAVWVFALARRLSGRVGVSAAAALLFALHPLRVEVVAWSSAMAVRARLAVRAAVDACVSGRAGTTADDRALDRAVRHVAARAASRDRFARRALRAGLVARGRHAGRPLRQALADAAVCSARRSGRLRRIDGATDGRHL